MKIILGVIAVMLVASLGATLMIGAPLAYAQLGATSSMTSTEPGRLSELPHSHHAEAAYQSGFEHGVIDGNRPSNATSYIDQPKHGFAWHSSEFVKGYVNGYCSIPANKDVGTDDDRAAFYCPDGPSFCEMVHRQARANYRGRRCSHLRHSISGCECNISIRR